MKSKLFTPASGLFTFCFTFWILIYGLHHHPWITSAEISAAITVAFAVSLWVWVSLERRGNNRFAFVFVIIANFIFWLLLFGLDYRSWLVSFEVAIGCTVALALALLLWKWVEG
jgi:uncharacterized membrane protein YccC